MLAMVGANTLLQWLSGRVQYKSKSVKRQIKEALISLLFLRPIVDAYRVSTNYEDIDGAGTIDALNITMINKCIELATESIPGCVLQVYVWLKNPEEAGTFALVSIGISALTTGYTSAVLSFNYDVDVPHRKKEPQFYGYLPGKLAKRKSKMKTRKRLETMHCSAVVVKLTISHLYTRFARFNLSRHLALRARAEENDWRVRCFTLIMLISTLHNLSRSVAYALLGLTDTALLFYFIEGEMLIFFAYKIARKDFWYWPRMDGATKVIGSIFARVVVKTFADFSGCLQLRHPYELGGLGFSASMIWAQMMPFVALQLYEGGEDSSIEENLLIFLSCR